MHLNSESITNLIADALAHACNRANRQIDRADLIKFGVEPKNCDIDLLQTGTLEEICQMFGRVPLENVVEDRYLDHADPWELLELQAPVVCRSGNQVVLEIEASCGSRQESAQILTAAIEDVVAKELLANLLCKFGTLYRVAEELNANFVVSSPGSQIERWGIVVIAHFDRSRADDEIVIDLISNFPWQGGEAWLSPNGSCSGD